MSSIHELMIFDQEVVCQTGMIPNEYLYYYLIKRCERLTA